MLTQSQIEMLESLELQYDAKLNQFGADEEWRYCRDTLRQIIDIANRPSYLERIAVALERIERYGIKTYNSEE